MFLKHCSSGKEFNSGERDFFFFICPRPTPSIRFEIVWVIGYFAKQKYFLFDDFLFAIKVWFFHKTLLFQI